MDFEAAEALAGATSVSDPIFLQMGKPEGYRLEQNYPNPFNPTTTIELALPERSRITLEVFNVLGQRVGLLADGIFETGTHRVTFDGRGLASGLYFYRFASPRWVQTRIMAMVK